MKTCTTNHCNCIVNALGLTAVAIALATGVANLSRAVYATFHRKRQEWRGDRYVLEIEGETRQSRLFGENLRLRRRISTGSTPGP